MTLSPDNELIASGTCDGNVKLWKVFPKV